MDTFNALHLPAQLASAITRLGFERPTPIQSQAIPVALSGKDLIGCAQTGTGKTAAFCIPIFSRMLRSTGDLALVLVPTRELARQIEDFWLELSQHHRTFGCVSLIGGVAISPQIRALSRHPRLVIATPGRLIDHIEQRTISLAKTSVLVLDEADRMLDMGFEPQLSRIAKHVPRERQTLLFSATMPPEAERLAARFVRNPVRVNAGAVSRTADRVLQKVVMTDVKHKNDTLLDEINRWPNDSILVFARTKSRTDRVARFLDSYGLNVARIHGGRSQGQRNKALGDFRAGDVRILVATDIAARGIDVTNIGFVINYDLPQVPEDYVHRIGRTGRAGASGEAVSLVTHEDRAQWREIVNLLKRTGSAVPEIVPGTTMTAARGMTDEQAESRHAGKTQPRTIQAGTPGGEARGPRPSQRDARGPSSPGRRRRRPRSRRHRSRPSA